MTKKEFIIQDLLCKIYQDQFSDGKLPNQRKLAEMYGVSRFTIQQSIDVMEEMGVLDVIQGSGIYIRKKWKKNPMIFNSLSRTPYERIESKMLKLEKMKATQEERQIFQLGEDEAVWYFERLRLVDFKIQQFEVSKLPVSLFPNLTKEIVEGSIQNFVADSGYRISHYMTSYRPIVIDKKQMDLFMCKKGTPAMLIQNRGLLEDGRIFQYSEVTSIDYSVSYIRPYTTEEHRQKNS